MRDASDIDSDATREYCVTRDGYTAYVVVDADGDAWRASVRIVDPTPPHDPTEVGEIVGGLDKCTYGGLVAAVVALDCLVED